MNEELAKLRQQVEEYRSRAKRRNVDAATYQRLANQNTFEAAKATVYADLIEQKILAMSQQELAA